MPILASEPDAFPENLFDSDTVLPTDGRAWWVLHTRPRQEKSLARQLHAEGLPYYLPSVARRSLIRGRVMTAHIPLFPSYLFLLGDDRERVRALTTGRVVRTLAVVDQPRAWHDLRQIQTLIASGTPIRPEDKLEPGILVEIHSGPLCGLQGRILRGASGNRFVVQVDFIQKGASVEIEDYLLSPLNN